MCDWIENVHRSRAYTQLYGSSVAVISISQIFLIQAQWFSAWFVPTLIIALHCHHKAQLFCTNTFCCNILSFSTAIYSQYAKNRDKIFINFYLRVQTSAKYHKNYQDQTNSLWVIRHQALGENVLGLNS